MQNAIIISIVKDTLAAVIDEDRIIAKIADFLIEI